MPRYPLDGRVVLITGAGRGLGAATAAALARRGARVVVTEVDLASARRVAADLPGAGPAVECDVTRPDSLADAVRQTIAEFGRIDVVVANAGVLGQCATMRALTPQQVKGVLSVNVDGVVNTVSATVEPVIRSRGQFVLISSVFAYVNGAGATPYAMSKAAVEQLGRGLRVELAVHGASAMTAYFSLIETDMIRDRVDADPHARALLAAAGPDYLLRKISPEVAGTAIADGLERRRASITVPARWRPLAALRGLTGPVLDSKLAGDPTARAALEQLDVPRTVTSSSRNTARQEPAIEPSPPTPQRVRLPQITS